MNERRRFSVWMHSRPVLSMLVATFACSSDEPSDEPRPLVLGDIDLPRARIDEPYEHWLSASGGVPPYRFAIESGSLPAGLLLEASTGRLTGIPRDPGWSRHSVRVRDALEASSTALLELFVVPRSLRIETTTLSKARAEHPFRVALRASGGVPPHAWTLERGALPAGLVLETSGEIAGAPTEPGRSEFMVRVTDALASERTRELELVVATRDPRIVTSTLAKARIGVPYAASMQAEGGAPPYAWSLLDGRLPDGLELSSDGTISGVPSREGAFAFRIGVVDAESTRTEADYVLGSLDRLSIVTAQFPRAIIGRPVHFAFEADGGEPPYEWSVLEETPLPTGFSIDATGVLEGTSASSFEVPVDVRVRDRDGLRDTTRFTFISGDRFRYRVEPLAAFPPTPCTTGTTASYRVVDLDVAESIAISDIDAAIAIDWRTPAGRPGGNSVLSLELVAPDGTRSFLCGDGAEIPGGIECDGRGGIDVTFDDERRTGIAPQRPLSTFDGTNPRGTWKLRVGVATPIFFPNDDRRCEGDGVIRSIELAISDVRSAADYVIVRGYSKNNLLIEPWVRIRGGGTDEHELFLSANVFGVGENGIAEAGAGDDVVRDVPFTWAWSGRVIEGSTVSVDGAILAGEVTGSSMVTASGGGHVVDVPIHVTAPDFNTASRVY